MIIICLAGRLWEWICKWLVYGRTCCPSLPIRWEDMPLCEFCLSCGIHRWGTSPRGQKSPSQTCPWCWWYIRLVFKFLNPQLEVFQLRPMDFQLQVHFQPQFLTIDFSQDWNKMSTCSLQYQCTSGATTFAQLKQSVEFMSKDHFMREFKTLGALMSSTEMALTNPRARFYRCLSLILLVLQIAFNCTVLPVSPSPPVCSWLHFPRMDLACSF